MPIITDSELAEKLWSQAEAEEAQRAADMPTEQDAIREMWRAYQRLKELGWNDAIYCPKDGTVFDAIEAGSTGIFDCNYYGEWPSGSWQLFDGGDIWPSTIKTAMADSIPVASAPRTVMGLRRCSEAPNKKDRKPIKSWAVMQAGAALGGFLECKRERRVSITSDGWRSPGLTSGLNSGNLSPSQNGGAA